MDTGLGRLGEILLLVYGLFISTYIGWWGYILIAGRYDLIEKWWQTQPQWARKLVLVKKLPRFVEVLFGIVLLTSSLISLASICVLLIRNLSQIGR